MYEFQYTFKELQKIRPSFVGSDHADEIYFVFGLCFLNGHIKINGKLKIIGFFNNYALMQLAKSEKISVLSLFLSQLGQFTEEENKLCRTMMAYWGNFARTGWVNT